MDFGLTASVRTESFCAAMMLPCRGEKKDPQKGKRERERGGIRLLSLCKFKLGLEPNCCPNPPTHTQTTIATTPRERAPTNLDLKLAAHECLHGVELAAHPGCEKARGATAGVR